MTTPTKEQIEKVLREVKKHTEKQTRPFIILGLMDLGYDEDEIVTFIIEEWEKIRNNPK